MPCHEIFLHLVLSSELLDSVHGPLDDGGRVGLHAGAHQPHLGADLRGVGAADVDSVPGNCNELSKIELQVAASSLLLHDFCLRQIFTADLLCRNVLNE